MFFLCAVFREETCLAFYLNGDVGSLICLLLLSLLLLKPAVSVDCQRSLRQETGRKEGKTLTRQRDGAQIYVGMRAYIQRRRAMGLETHTQTEPHTYTDTKKLIPFILSHARQRARISLIAATV